MFNSTKRSEMKPVVMLDARGKRYTLTVDHPCSRDGLPVLMDEDGSAFGPTETLRDRHGGWIPAYKFVDQLYLADLKQRDCELIRRWNAAVLRW